MNVLVFILSVILWNSCNGMKTFPPGFKFGAATSGYQVEGAWEEDGAVDNSTGDVLVESQRWKDDVRLATELGLHFYRFSISWPSLFPTGLINEIDATAVQYYNNLIDELIQAGIEPVVTMYQWDLPLRIQELGGWSNPLISDWFADFSRKLFTLFGDRVKTWITINEPNVICDYGYTDGRMTSEIEEKEFAPYICTKNVLMAHAKAYRIYEREFKPFHGGRISISNNYVWLVAESPGDEDIAELAMEYTAGRYSHPIFSKEGGWPPKIEQLLVEVSDAEGYNRSLIPSFTQDEKDFVRGTADFLSVNYYATRTVKLAGPDEMFEDSIPFGIPGKKAVLGIPNGTLDGKQSITNAVGLRRLLSWLTRSYGDWSILIAEAGYSTELNDDARVELLKEQLEQVYLSIFKDGVNIEGYTVWSLVDNLESLFGYGSRNGLYKIDVADPSKKTPRLSAKYYACVIQNNGIPELGTEQNKCLGTKRTKRQLLPKPDKIKDTMEFMKEVAENRKCIMKVMALGVKMMSLLGNN